MLSQLLESWSSLYGNHAVLRTGIEFMHIGGRVLLFAADVGTFMYSRIFWLKMALMLALLVNGALLLVAERQAKQGEARAWARLHYTAVSSLVLWFVTTLAGAALPNIG
jgi:hypothetical protein